MDFKLTHYPVRHHLDRTELPPPTTHGDPAHFLVEGWLLGTPPAHPVHLRIGPKAILTGFCNVPRADVAKAFPGYGVTNAGFVLKGTVRDVPPGSHDVALDFGAGPPITLGRVEILRLFEFSSHRPLGPDSWPAGRPVPVCIDGELRTSVRAESVAVKVDSHSVDVATFLSEGVCDAHGWWVHEVLVTGHASALGTSEQHTLDLEFTLAGGGLRTWTLPFTVAPTDVSCTPRTITLGPYDPDTGLTTVFLDVEVFDVEAGDRLALERNGVKVLETVLRVGSTSDAAGTGRGLAVVDRQVENIPAGAGQFSLVLLRGHRRSVVWAGTVYVRYHRPEIHIDTLAVSLVRAGEIPTYRLETAGWVRHHFLVDHLLVEVGGSSATVVGLQELRPDVAKALGNPMATRQGFNTTIDFAVPPGEHVVHFVAIQQNEERGRVSRRVLFEEPPALHLSVQSDHLERLLRGPQVTCYSSIALRGTLRTQLDDVRVTLSVNDTRGDEQAFEGPGDHEFLLRAVPESSGEYEVRLTVRSRGRLVFQSDPARVLFQEVEFSRGLERDLGTLLDRFDLRSKIGGTMSDRELVTRMLEAQPERVHEFSGMLVEAAKRIGAATPNRRWIEPPDITSPRRLKVLFASWETPTRRHGGGVYLRALLSRLGARHDITLVHSCGLDEVGQADSLRPHLRRIISVPRAHTPAKYRGIGCFPLHLYDNYTPELRRVLELEVASGSYDIADYEYSAMGPYVVPGVPSVLTVHELGYTALLNTVFGLARPAEEVVGDLDRFVRSFHYFTSVLPSICNRLITLAGEDAAEIATFSGAHMYTSPSGVEVDDVSARTMREERDAPVFAYMGNFRHPPNARAAMFFAQKVMPQILRRYPLAEFRIYGPEVSGEVRDIDGRNGVRVMGFVDDLRSALESAIAFVAPIFTGTGQRIKVLEALGAGALIIGSDLSVRSIHVVDGEHYFRANTAEEFVAAALRAIEHPNEARRVAQAGRERAAKMHNWETAVRRREAIWFHALGEA